MAYKENMEHSLLYEKNTVTVTGAEGVDSFEDKETKISLTDGAILLKGSSFVLSDVNVAAKKVVFTGSLSSVEYVGKTDKSGLFKKIFK